MSEPLHFLDPRHLALLAAAEPSAEPSANPDPAANPPVPDEPPSAEELAQGDEELVAATSSLERITKAVSILATVEGELAPFAQAALHGIAGVAATAVGTELGGPIGGAVAGVVEEAAATVAQDAAAKLLPLVREAVAKIKAAL